MRDSDYDLIKLEATEEGLAVVVINRPDVHNAFNMELVTKHCAVIARGSVQETSVAMPTLAARPAFWVRPMARLVVLRSPSIPTSPAVAIAALVR